MHIMPNLGSDLMEPPSCRTFTLVVSRNSRYDYVLSGQQILINYLAKFNQIRYETSILVDADVHCAISRI